MADIQLVGSATGAYWRNVVVPYVSTAGNTLVLVYAIASNDSSVSVTDSAGNSWAKVVDNLSTSADGQRQIAMWVCLNASSVTEVTVSDTTNAAVVLSEWSGVGSIGMTSFGYRSEAPVTVGSGEIAISAVSWYQDVPLGVQQLPDSPFDMIDGVDSQQDANIQIWMAMTDMVGSVSAAWPGEKPNNGKVAVVLRPTSLVDPVEGSSVTVWSGTSEVPATLSIWDGSEERSIGSISVNQ